jgi:hypothetical protein
MYKKLLLLIPLLFLFGCTVPQPPIGGGSDISATSLADKYDKDTKTKSKYTLEGSSLKMIAKADPKDEITVTVGDEPTPGVLGGAGDFNPKVKIERWGEVSLTLTPKDLDKVATKDKTLDLSNGKIKVGTPNANYQIYDLPISADNPEGGLEYEIDLLSKPASNVIQFQLDTQGLDFFYQPPLNEEMKGQEGWTEDCTPTDCGSSHRPENVVGSYAVYAKTPKTNYTDGKEYKCGKIGHIFRPKIIDSAGTSIWGDLHIENGILSVTIPQEFLDKAVYPVRHAAGLTFGYTTIAGTRSAFGISNLRVSHTYAPASTGTITDIQYFSESNGGSTDYVRGVLYLHDDNTRVTYGAEVTWGDTGNPLGGLWRTLDVTDTAVTSGISYNIGIWQTAGDANGPIFYYDTSQTPDILRDNTAYHATNAPPATYTVNSTITGYRWSIYATYTASGGGTTAPPKIPALPTD